ncbi:MAG TPA: bifunctional histidinol-phosphatase/imidazoleglycerol-phosphate dehydratase HisB [Chitinophagales bacterium]|nr:bifunctional histidinol-phosphatase/imidazoleglycerol-phosphate dehydratase HisB [Chitinophagales bacterium]MCB9074731.1 bifunctional histidinol-phosphatase/imidazoleglycerol-phosphate dehydratase HisB [Chitinophagales bacterium]HNB38418.1 bifunctional histidinol-phosphatase/imidazoleglycerol-phosphate dehydratase HisB [Chitinophagales bacterium]HNC63676.1 bifunctional histidinol-phosphatase/imidazoleglycerol-phosphate dehydratase HisB [Chitinophagales bacterium]HNE86487.1 bifunctional histi
MKQKVLFIDRDGTIIVEPKDNFQTDKFEKLAFLPNVISALKRIVNESNFKLVMVTNQDGLGTKSFPEKSFWGPHNLMLSILETEGVQFEDIYIDKTFAKDNAPTRKPNTGLLTKYLDTSKYDLENSLVIGDRLTDIQLAKNIGAKGILIGRSADTTDDDKLNQKALKPFIALKTNEWNKIADFICKPNRTASIQRNTNETQIQINLNLDGNGKSKIHTGLGFFDHMLEQLSRHSGCDLEIKVKGDLHIDEHHTIEDTAIALGEAFYQAIGDKRGINRYGFLLPMDDVLAQVAIDFSGRSWLVWKAKFSREKVGDMPTEMFYHFWKSFSDAAKCNLNIKAEGDNEHHKIEAIFKAVAKSIKMAIKKDGNELPTTKGLL